MWYFNIHLKSKEKTKSQKDWSISVPITKTVASRHDYVLRSDINEVIPDTNIKTRIYSIYHKYVFINSTTGKIKVYQTECPDKFYFIEPNKRLPFFWTNEKLALAVTIEYENHKPTDYFYLTEVGTIVEQLIRTDNNKFSDLIRIERFIDKGTKYIKIMPESIDHPCYIIQNESQYVSLAYREKESKLPFRYLDCESKTALGWVFPQKPHEIQVKFLWGKLSQKPLVLQNQKEYFYSMENISMSPYVDLELSMGYGKYLWLSLESDGVSKILRIKDMLKKYDPSERKIDQKSQIVVENLGISIVSTYLNEKLELLYLTMQGIKYSVTGNDTEKSSEIVIQNLQIDNQMKEQTSFPVTLSRKPNLPEEKPFIKISLKTSTLIEQKPNVYAYETVQVDIVPFIVKLEEDQIYAMTEFISNFISQSEPENPMLETSLHKNDLLPIKNIDPNAESTVSIEKFMVSELLLNIWYKPSMENKGSSNLITKSLAAAFLNVKEMPITLEGLTFFNLYGKFKTILMMIASDYQQLLESKKFGIAAGVIFAPFRDITQLGTGVTNFITSPMGGATGIVSGAGGLVKGAVAGTFGTASGVTNVVSQGVLALSMDEEYIKEKQKDDEKYKPANVIEGLGFGFFSVLKSVGSGVTGIVSKPIEGASKGGVKGFFKVDFYFFLLFIGNWGRCCWCSHKTNKWWIRFCSKNNRRHKKHHHDFRRRS